eukprot:4134997-Pyramimonas_sp.AAC.1
MASPPAFLRPNLGPLSAQFIWPATLFRGRRSLIYRRPCPTMRLAPSGFLPALCARCDARWR